MGVYLYTARKANPITAQTDQGPVQIFRMVFDWKLWFDSRLDRPMNLAMGRAERAWKGGLQDHLVVEAEKEGLRHLEGAPVYRRTGSPSWIDTDRLGEQVGTLRVEGTRVRMEPFRSVDARFREGEEVEVARPTGYSRGKKLDQRYRMVLHRRDGQGPPLIRVDQEIPDGYAGPDKPWYPAGGSWYLQTLLEGRREHRVDALSLDAGQGWEIRGGVIAGIWVAEQICKRVGVEINWRAYA